MEDKHVQVRKHRREHRHNVRKRGIKEKAAKSAKHWVRKTERRERETSRARPMEAAVLPLHDHHQPAPTCHRPAVIATDSGRLQQDTRPPGSTPPKGVAKERGSCYSTVVKGPAISRRESDHRRPRIQSTGPLKAPRRVSVLN